MGLIRLVTHATLPGPLATPKVDSKWSFQICSQSENGNLQTLESFFYQTACLLNSEVLLAPNIHRTKVSPAIMSSPNNKLAAPHNCNCHLKLLIATLPPEPAVDNFSPAFLLHCTLYLPPSTASGRSVHLPCNCFYLPKLASNCALN